MSTWALPTEEELWSQIILLWNDCRMCWWLLPVLGSNGLELGLPVLAIDRTTQERPLHLFSQLSSLAICFCYPSPLTLPWVTILSKLHPKHFSFCAFPEELRLPMLWEWQDFSFCCEGQRPSRLLNFPIQLSGSINTQWNFLLQMRILILSLAW